jgi:hypothetical protein
MTGFVTMIGGDGCKKDDLIITSKKCNLTI